LQTATGHAELGGQICLGWTRKDGKNAEPADTLNNLGIPDRDQNRMEDARKEYEETLKTYRELAQKDPETYLPYVAATLNDLGFLDSNQNRMEEAREEYEESLKIYR
jgi:tetratricopeptide (TPR) repeat protein